MKMLQMYETTIMSDDTPHAMHVVVVPGRSEPMGDSAQPDHLLDALGLTKLARADASNLAKQLAFVLTPGLPAHEVPQALATSSQGHVSSLPLSPDDVRFAEIAASERLIPFEQSPLSLESLGRLVTTAGGAGVGAYVGFVAYGSGPMLLITVPAGMLICGAARGVAQALEEGLKDRLLTWLKGNRAESA